MKNKTITSIARLAVSTMLLMVLAGSNANGEYELSWYTIDGGGGRRSGGPYTLTGTIGQPDAAWSSGGKYELLGGFWPGGLPADLDGSGEVDFADLKDFAELWLKCYPVGWPLK